MKRVMGAVALGLALVASAASFAPPPVPTRWATDTADFLSPDALARLDARLEAYETETGRQVVVFIAPTTGEVPLEEWAARTFQAWGIGRKGKDDGLALFVFSEDRALRFEVGYGLEGELTDAAASRIIEQVAIPRLKAGDPDGAVEGAVRAALGHLDGTAAPDAAVPAEMDGLTAAVTLFVFFLMGVLALACFLSPWVAIGGVMYIALKNKGPGGAGGTGGIHQAPRRSTTSGSSGFSSGSSGSSFRSGGGRSGGGGASGRW